MKNKIIIIIIILVIFVLDIYLIYNYIYIKYKNKFLLEKNDIAFSESISSIPFKIDKIIFFSSAFGENKNTNFQTSNWILDIFQYTDIAIYISATEAIKNLSISNFTTSSTNQKLYYLDSNNFGTEEILYDYEITDTFDFSVLNFDNSENTLQYNTPIFFADASTPITLKYVNNIFNNYSISNEEKLQFNGSLLSKTNISLKELENNISFDITLTNYNNENFSNTLSLDIPLKDNNTSILDNYFYLEKNNLNIPILSIMNTPKNLTLEK